MGSQETLSSNNLEEEQILKKDFNLEKEEQILRSHAS